MKTVGYLIFAAFYYIFRLFCPIRKKKVFAVMTHDGSPYGNVGVMVNYLKRREEGYTFHYLKKEDRNMAGSLNAVMGKAAFFIVKPYHLATSQFVLLDNAFLPMAYIVFSKKVSVIQLWHGTGTIKRFGQYVNTGWLSKLEKRANEKITHLIVSSEESKSESAGAFGVEEDKIFIYGLPRTDIFFDRDQIEERKLKFYKQYPKLTGKKLILYAPTFRDLETEHPKLALDSAKLLEGLPEDYVILLRLHPFVAAACEKDVGTNQGNAGQVINMSSYDDINTLLMVSDYLITDYSSVIFEYCLLNKPIIFYAYDLEEFSDHGRGFNRPYEEYVPGPIAKDTEDILNLLKNDQFDLTKIRSFVNRSYRFLDGNSAERLYLHIFKDKA